MIVLQSQHGFMEKQFMTVEDNKAQVVLVDAQGEVLGYEEKLKAHQEGKLHLAFSIFIFNSSGEMLLQQRAFSKYHFAGLWSNTCCSHPFPQESIEQAAHRRLQEEMGFDTTLTQAFSFLYKATDNQSGLTEHELDYVFTGVYNGIVLPDTREVNAFRWLTPDTLYKEIAHNQDMFTIWFRIAIDKLKENTLWPNEK